MSGGGPCVLTPARTGSRDRVPCVDFRFGHLALLSPAASFAGWSTLIGVGARTRVPHLLRAPAYRAFARAVGADLSEVELALGDYDTFGDFFARKLKPGAR